LERIEEQMVSPEPLKVRIQVTFVRPDGTISGRRILESGKPDVIIQEDEDD
jgi:hypothetical protein